MKDTPVSPTKTPSRREAEAPTSSGVSDFAHFHRLAEIAELERQVGILQRDNAQLIEQNREQDGRLREWRASLGVKEDQDATAALARLNENARAQGARVAELQDALGVDERDDPSVAAARRKARGKGGDTESLTGLPAYGHLLLLTTLANLEGVGGYGQTPSTLYPGNGDEWTATVEQVPVGDGALQAQIVIGVRPNLFGYQDAAMRHRQTSTELAESLKAERAARRQLAGLQGPRDRAAKAELERQIAEFAERSQALGATLRELQPRLEPPRERTWRFAGGLADFGGTVAPD